MEIAIVLFIGCSLDIQEHLYKVLCLKYTMNLLNFDILSDVIMVISKNKTSGVYLR